ncbi:hypothetical protein ACFL0V_00510 [Nanoarchaeota archaeon]
MPVKKETKREPLLEKMGEVVNAIHDYHNMYDELAIELLHIRKFNFDKQRDRVSMFAKRLKDAIDDCLIFSKKGYIPAYRLLPLFPKHERLFNHQRKDLAKALRRVLVKLLRAMKKKPEKFDLEALFGKVTRHDLDHMTATANAMFHLIATMPKFEDHYIDLLRGKRLFEHCKRKDVADIWNRHVEDWTKVVELKDLKIQASLRFFDFRKVHFINCTFQAETMFSEKVISRFTSCTFINLKAPIGGTMSPRYRLIFLRSELHSCTFTSFMKNNMNTLHFENCVITGDLVFRLLNGTVVQFNNVDILSKRTGYLRHRAEPFHKPVISLIDRSNDNRTLIPKCIIEHSHKARFWFKDVFVKSLECKINREIEILLKSDSKTRSWIEHLNMHRTTGNFTVKDSNLGSPSKESRILGCSLRMAFEKDSKCIHVDYFGGHIISQVLFGDKVQVENCHFETHFDVSHCRPKTFPGSTFHHTGMGNSNMEFVFPEDIIGAKFHKFELKAIIEGRGRQSLIKDSDFADCALYLNASSSRYVFNNCHIHDTAINSGSTSVKYYKCVFYHVMYAHSRLGNVDFEKCKYTSPIEWKQCKELPIDFTSPRKNVLSTQERLMAGLPPR